MSDVLVDTAVWSLALRHRRSTQSTAVVLELEELVREMRVRVIGPVRQEILSGIKDRKKFQLLRAHLRGFPDLQLREVDYERAAELFNLCRASGIQGSNTDFLICAVAEHNDLSVFTTDKDFKLYQKFGRFILHEPR